MNPLRPLIFARLRALRRAFPQGTIVRWVVGLAASAWLTAPAQAEPHRCAGADGRVTFQDAPCAGEVTRDAPRSAAAAPDHDNGKRLPAMPAAWSRLQQLTIYIAKCPLNDRARIEFELIRQDLAPTWQAIKLDQQAAFDLLSANGRRVEQEMAGNPAAACAAAQRELDDWIQRIPNAQRRFDNWVRGIPESR